MPDHWYNIEGCLAKYRDLESTEKWLARAHDELSSADFSKLLDRLWSWLIDNPAFDDLSEGVSQLLFVYDPIGDSVRRSLYAQERRRMREEEELRKAKERDECERARQEEQRRERELREAEERRIREEGLAVRREAVLARIQQAFESDFLGAEEIFDANTDNGLVGREQFERLKTEFVLDWASREIQRPLDSEQAVAVGAINGDIQVVARAGSGKTRTLVTRAIFLLKHCGVAPRELLLLAFNKKAAEEIKRRITESVDGNLPHVMTFHALAHALVHPEESLVFDDTNTDQFALSREVQEVIDEHVRAEDYSDRIRELMLSQFRDDWERIVDGRFEFTMEEFLAHRRALPRESLKGGDYVKSFGEKLIANTLFEHGVEYYYERNFRWDGINYRPDFTIRLGSKGGVIIEYFGLRCDADYDEMSDKKRAFWAGRDEWTFLEFSPTDIAQNGVEVFVDTLTQKLRIAGVPCQRQSEEEIWELVRRRALDNFTKAMRTFVGRCRKKNLSPDDLNELVAGHDPCSRAEALFLDVGVSVYRGYSARLIAKQKEDFDGLMWCAVAVVRGGHTHFVRDKGRERGNVSALRFVMIDEFQDFSKMFFDLVAAIRSRNADVRFFCVGDDWQAINAFAGSDLIFFEKFTQYFQDTSEYLIHTNYRSSRGVVEVGNALMKRLGVAAKAQRTDGGWVRLCKIDAFKPSTAEQARHCGDDVTPALLRLLRKLLDRGLDVVMLQAQWRAVVREL